ncbi:hypothetical protein HUT18_01130 [Streptomyces sp. NA04227]|nr:hypothetical protein HUT18_01130 [Streptomyces sp. NA04227]
MLPLVAGAQVAHAAPEFTVTAHGDTVEARTTACARGGIAKLLATGRANPVQGHTLPLTGPAPARSATWSGLEPGAYTVSVLCRDGSSPGARSVRVAGSARSMSAPNAQPNAQPTSPATISATSTPRRSPSPSPTPSSSASRGVRGGVGGSRTDIGTLTLAGGSALVALAAGVGAWQLRRRTGGRRPL